MKKVLFILLLLVVALAVVPLFLPKTMHVEEEYEFNAPVERVFSHFNDLRRFTAFDAWSKKDPDIKLNFSSPATGDGASYMWSSKSRDLGEGSMSIADVKDNEFINYMLNFGEMKGNTTEVIFQKMDEGRTKVIWSFDSAEAGYPFQVFNILMKGSVKDNLHQSLVNLDSILSKQSEVKLVNQDITKGGFAVKEEKAKRLFGVMQQTTTSPEEMGTAMSESLGFVHSYLRDANGMTEEEIGAPVVLWKQYSEESNLALFYSGFIIAENVPEKDDLEYVLIPGGKYLTTIHNGAHNTISITYDRLHKFAEVNNLELSNSTYDVYLNQGGEMAERDLKTQIYIPVLN